MGQGYIDAVNNKTEEEKADERWRCYQQLRETFPETFGSVDLNGLNIDQYFEGIDDLEPQHERKVEYMAKIPKAGIIAIIAVVVIIAIAVVVNVTVNKDDEVARQQLEIQQQQLSLELERQQEDKDRQAATDAFLNTTFEKAKEPDYSF